MGTVLLYRIEPSRNMRRYYRLDLQPDLFGRWLLVVEWGRIGCLGQTQVDSFATRELAHEALRRRRGCKERRGYLACVTG